MASLPRKGMSVICGATTQSIEPSCFLNGSPMLERVSKLLIEILPFATSLVRTAAGRRRATCCRHFLDVVGEAGGGVNRAEARPTRRCRASR